MLEVTIRKSGIKSDKTHWAIVQWEVNNLFLVEGFVSSTKSLGKEGDKVTVPKTTIRQMK